MTNKLISFFALITLNTYFIYAQDYIKDGETRLNFANTYLELGANYRPSFEGYALAENNTLESVHNSASIAPNLNIGGIHFWGHADFYISIPLSQFSLDKTNNSDFVLTESVVTGARYLPWMYRHNKVRPYIGAKWTVLNLKQGNGENQHQPLHSKHKLTFDSGVLFGRNNFMFRCGVNYTPKSEWNYPIAENTFREIKTPEWSFNVGLIYSMETTRPKDNEPYAKKLNQYPISSAPTLDASKRGDWFCGIAPSSSFSVSHSRYNTETYPYLNKKPISNVFLDVALGYHFNKKGIITALSYRSPKFSNEGYNMSQTIKKRSVVLETYKFLFDYNGFTPYIGVNIGFSKIDYSEQSSNHDFSISYTNITPGLTMGWDILPGKTGQSIVLRTNLRWLPFETFNVNGIEFSQNQIEYNLIQLVFYPSRHKAMKRKIG